MSWHQEHQRLRPVLELARKLDIATNSAPEALFEAGSAGFQIWCTTDDHPKGWDGVTMTAGAFAKPCAFVASVYWGWTDATVTHLQLETDAFDLKRRGEERPAHNHPDDVAWAKAKARSLFEQAGLACPPIRLEAEA